jgi:uncharacterized protein (DUF849 family)
MHARDPRDGRPSQAPEHFVPILETLKQNTNAVINLTTGRSPHMTVAERMRPAKALNLEVATPGEARQMLQLEGSAAVGF